MKILIAEDDTLTRKMLEVSLKRWGYACDTAENGQEAWEKHETNAYDIIVTDWLMPGMEGTELTRKIRRLKESAYTYIILLTSLERKEHLSDGLDVGADDYIQKPFEPSELRARIKAGERIVTLERSLRNSNERMKRELKEAAKTLESLLPKDNSLFPHFNYAYRFFPSEILGGDFFNIIKLSETLTAFYMVDVAGHGVPAALLSTTLSHLLSPLPEFGGILTRSSQNPDSIIPPSEVAQKLNARFQLVEETSMFFTMFYGIHDRKSGLLRWVRAGHPRPLLLSGNEINYLEGGSPPIGMLPDLTFEQHQTKLGAGDSLIIYSDGITETSQGDTTLFGEGNLLDTVTKHRRENLEDIVESVIEAISSFSGRKVPEDDISILALSFQGKSSPIAQ